MPPDRTPDTGLPSEKAVEVRSIRIREGRATLKKGERIIGANVTVLPGYGTPTVQTWIVVASESPEAPDA
jgi:hypothetical protein